LIASRLQRLGVAERLVDAAIRAMAPVAIAKAEDRSVLGFLVDFANDEPLPSGRPVRGTKRRCRSLRPNWPERRVIRASALKTRSFLIERRRSW